MIKKSIAALLLSLTIGSAQAMSTDEAINICSTVAAITQDALEDMQRRRVPLEKTAIYAEVGRDPHIVKALQSAVALHKRGVSIPQVVDAWAQGCVQALTVSSPISGTVGARSMR